VSVNRLPSTRSEEHEWHLLQRDAEQKHSAPDIPRRGIIQRRGGARFHFGDRVNFHALPTENPNSPGAAERRVLGGSAALPMTAASRSRTKCFPNVVKNKAGTVTTFAEHAKKYNRGNELPRTMPGAGIKARLYLTTWPARTAVLEESPRVHTRSRARARNIIIS
jgi:hypothetical protein